MLRRDISPTEVHEERVAGMVGAPITENVSGILQTEIALREPSTGVV